MPVLMLLVAAAAALRLRPVMGAEPLCRVHVVRTGKVFNVVQPVDGDRLYFSSSAPRLVKHPCHKNLGLYLGKQVFLTRDNFESSLLPFTIPASMAVGVPEVTSAHFAGPFLLLVVNHRVYTYDYKDGVWGAATGVDHPVSHVSGDNCCDSSKTFCMSISDSVFAYSHGELVAQANVYFSTTRGQSFQRYSIERQAELNGTLGGIFYFHSLSQVGLLAVNKGKGQFAYSHHPLNRSLGLAFDYNGTLNVLTVPGQRGVLVFWFENSLLFSPNAGQLIDTVQVWRGEQVLHPSIYGANITVHNIAANENELAVLTQEDHLYYGSLGILSSPIIKISEQPVWSPEAALMFTGTGMLQVLTPLADAAFPAFDFRKCSVNVQAVLMDPKLQVGKCKIELLDGLFRQEVYTVDMNSELELEAILIPRLGTSPIPLAVVSNPYSLGLQASIYEFGSTFNGNTKYKLDIHLKQQQHWGRTDPNFTSSIKRPTMSALTVDVANKEISCVDMKPLSTRISLGCDLQKRILVQKEFYDPSFRGRKAAKDLTVAYPYKDLGCPRLVYYDMPWSPVVELWRGEQFREVVKAEHVLLEVNGLFSYSYSLTARAALCTAQPQNWSSVLAASPGRGPAAWNRQNYVSCHDPNNKEPLRWPQAPYEVLGGRTDNQIIFEQRNGIYVFHIAIVDPYYSYCHLETTFSVYVYGAYPLPAVPSDVAIALLLAAILLAVWLAYWVPQQAHSEAGLRVKAFWARLWHRCQHPLGCLRGQR
ncbi:cation channel sperm-associated auxiliary subunit delta isoform X3 [Oryctolagus cuniculus]|uniref:cation channel sperm-associated auxiliary subunit delta isoform X3 n=1 Tax=Oryctolagus cuniculus TaxID=9986 RepID=UPI00387A690A